MVTEDIVILVSDSTNFFHRSTDWSKQGGYFVLDTHCTRSMIQLKIKAYQFHLKNFAIKRPDLAAKS